MPVQTIMVSDNSITEVVFKFLNDPHLADDEMNIPQGCLSNESLAAESKSYRRLCYANRSRLHQLGSKMDVTDEVLSIGAARAVILA